MQNIKMLLHSDDSIEVTGQVVAIRSYTQKDVVTQNVADKKAGEGSLYNQGWVYVGHFDKNEIPLGPNNPLVSNRKKIKETLTTKTLLNVRSGYPDFPFYKLAPAIGSIQGGKQVKVLNVVETGNNKYWAFAKYRT
ncbi:hypothetical protein [Vibrio coralliilyticus]|uniref:SH3 domain-containing protein n=1 Tax=Vibrio coralliilyticus TaxID=190893 RepID=A0AAP7DFF9_9VIBR|nr:hypothetical protein [Vibrio coralliilyticus]NOI31857.1 hypothetical protein [Vibrio coralliilyticus]NOJ25301.1 hypothetical protein [Vibrio coralliilyticus]